MASKEIQDLAKKLFTIDESRKTFTIVLEGFAGTDNASIFVDALRYGVSQINIADYLLVVDCTKLGIFKPEILPVLEQSYKLYMSFGFKNVIMINPKKATPRLQLRRMAKSSQFTGQFIDSMDALRNVALMYK